MMPIHEIQVSEYECVHCGYKWINRINGQDRPMPKNCAKCKRFHWNGKGEDHNPISPRERGLRMRLVKYEGFLNGRHYEPNELCKKFLSLNPRPTWQELNDAVYPLKYDTYKHRHDYLIPDPDPNRPNRPGYINLKLGYDKWIPNPNRDGWLMRNRDFYNSQYAKTIENETRLRRQAMKKAIESRGEQVPEEKTRKQLKEEYEQTAKAEILKLGKIMEENKTPTNKICQTLMQKFNGYVDASQIEKWCPPEWKGKTKK